MATYQKTKPSKIRPATARIKKQPPDRRWRLWIEHQSPFPPWETGAGYFGGVGEYRGMNLIVRIFSEPEGTSTRIAMNLILSPTFMLVFASSSPTITSLPLYLIA